MSDLISVLTRELSGAALGKLSGAAGADERSTQNAIAAALPVLIGAMARNASRPEGAHDLDRALERDHDGSILGNLGAVVGAAGGGAGEGILGHVLGERRPAVERGLSRTTGLDADAVSRLLVTLAPIVMGALGREKRVGGLDAGGLAAMLEREQAGVRARAPREMGVLEGLLDVDVDGDGDVEIDDLAQAGFGALGKLFGSR